MPHSYCTNASFDSLTLSVHTELKFNFKPAWWEKYVYDKWRELIICYWFQRTFGKQQYSCVESPIHRILERWISFSWNDNFTQPAPLSFRELRHILDIYFPFTMTPLHCKFPLAWTCEAFVRKTCWHMTDILFRWIGLFRITSLFITSKEQLSIDIGWLRSPASIYSCLAAVNLTNCSLITWLACLGSSSGSTFVSVTHLARVVSWVRGFIEGGREW